MKEKDMYSSIKRFFELKGEEVYAEVYDYDVVSIKETKQGKKSTIIEMKLSLNFKVLEQAINAKSRANYVYVAVPKPKTKHSYLALNILKDNGIGLLYVTKGRFKVIEQIRPEYKSIHNRRNVYNYVDEYNKELVGGVKKGDGDTQYSLMMKNVKEYMRGIKDKGYNDGWVTAQEIVDNVHTYYRNPKTSMMSTLKERWNADWCESKLDKRKRFFRIKD